MIKVLFLDDEKSLVDSLPLLLRQKGLEVSATHLVDQALEWFSEESFDVVLLDIMMPPAKDMDIEQTAFGRETGVEVARRMKDVRPDVQIVAFTVLTDPEIRKRIRKAGIVEILNKPAELSQIVDVLLRVARTRK